MKNKHIVLTSLVVFVGISGLLSRLTRLNILGITDNAESQEIEVQYNLEYGPHAKHKLDLCKPKNITRDLPGVMLMHGGNGDKQSFLATCKALAKRGIIAITINFREEPSPAYQVTLPDANESYQWLLNFEGVDQDKIGVMGGSLGGYIASMIATQESQDKPLCAVNNFGPTDFTDLNLESSKLADHFIDKFFGGVTFEENPELYTNLSPITHVTSNDSPHWLFTRSKNDKLVPKSQMTLMIDKLQSEGLQTEFHEYFGIGGGHANKMFPWMSKKLFNKRVDFLEGCLNTP